MNFEVRKRYKTRGGMIATCHKKNPYADSHNFKIDDYEFALDCDGLWNSGRSSPFDIISDVPLNPSPALAPGEWNTVKPDGTPGPVVTLRPMRIKDTGMQALVPFEADVPPLKSYYVTVDGLCVRFHDAGDRLRITTPYVKPSPLERLREARAEADKLKSELESHQIYVEAAKGLAKTLDAVIAEMEKA